LRITNVPDP